MADSILGKLYRDGEVVARQGERGDCMLVIQEGQLAVFKEHEGRLPVRVAVLNKGDIFGEMSLFEQEIRSATVQSVGESRVLTVDKKTFIRRVQEDPTLAFNLVRIMSQSIRNLIEETGERRTHERRVINNRRCNPDRRKQKKSK
jgi:CRP-like cAMP-binding protein